MLLPATTLCCMTLTTRDVNREGAVPVSPQQLSSDSERQKPEKNTTGSTNRRQHFKERDRLGPSDKLAPLKVARGAGAFSAFCSAPLQTTAAWAAAYCVFSWHLLKRNVDYAGHDGIEKADE
jgi:hypothetical protein